MRRSSSHFHRAALISGLALLPSHAQQPQEPSPAPATSAAVTATTGGSIHGSVKTGTTPLPGVAITATNTLTGKKYATTTAVDGTYAMTIPRTGRYVVRAELAAFAPVTAEVRITAEATDQSADFPLQLASRVAAAADTQTAAAATIARALGNGTVSLNISGDNSLSDATTNAASNSAALPSLAGLGDNADSVAVSGAQGTTNPLANLSEDQIRERVEDAMTNARLQGGAQGDQVNAVVGMLGNILGGNGGFGGPGGGGPGGGRGGRGGAGGGGFRNFNPAQPHGAVFYQGGNSALNSAPWSPTLLPLTNPAAYSNRFGISIAGSPYIPGLTKANTKQFVFINFTGQKNLNAFLPSPVRVPTALERTGDFSQSFQKVNGAVVPVTLYDPTTGQPIAGNNLANAATPLSPIAQNILKLNYYPLPNVVTSDPTGYNYQTISNAGSNNVAINARYVRQLGAAAPGGFGGGRGGTGGNRQARNAPPVLRQNINAAYNYSHSASDLRNIFLPLGGATATDGNGLNLGYTVSYGRLSNNASVNWNRNNSQTRNYFTGTANDPTTQTGISVPNNAGGFANPSFYNGLPSIGITNFAGLSNTTPYNVINQTIAFTDFIAWRHGKHNMRFGGDIRRVHYDSIGGNSPLGSFTFSGYATSAPADQVNSLGGINSGSGFADFLLGLPGSTGIQAGLYKTHLRENQYDAYAQDDFRVRANLTLNYGLRYEYFAPYTETNNRLVNLTHDATFTQIGTVLPGATGLPTSLVRPDRSMFAPRIGFAWRPSILPRVTKNLVIRGGYGINYNTGQYNVFARNLSHQAPFSVTQNNAAPIATKANPTPAATGCVTTQSAYTYTTASGTTATRPATTANLRLANGFSCSTALAITNNFAVDPNYRLGMVQVYNLNLQRTFPQGIVVNLGYNGSKGSNLDVVGSPNGTPSGTTTPGVAPFDYEYSAAASHANSLVVAVQRRQQKGIALGATYTYSHSIDNASGVGGVAGTPIQNFYRLDLENGNSSFDQRHNLTGNYLFELPFGPNREFLSKGGLASKLLDGFSLSGTFTFATGAWLTPQYSGSAAQASSANTFTLRPNRVAGQQIRGTGTVRSFFNTAAFTAPAAGQYGNASPGSIEGPGTVSVNTSLSRTVALGGTRNFEARMTATNVFNTVQYSGINVQINSANYGQVTSAAAMRALQFQARYRF